MPVAAGAPCRMPAVYSRVPLPAPRSLTRGPAMSGAATLIATVLEHAHMILRSLRPIILLLLALGFIPGPARAASTTIRVTGDDGSSVSLTAQPKRLISLAPSVTEVLFALGLGPKVVGVDTATNYPPAAKALPRVADYSSGPNYERILALKPDLLVAAAGVYSPQAITKLRGLHLQVLVTSPRDIPAVLRDIVLVGVAAGVSGTAMSVRGRPAGTDRSGEGPDPRRYRPAPRIL